jgi:hypothetical protein
MLKATHRFFRYCFHCCSNLTRLRFVYKNLFFRIFSSETISLSALIRFRKLRAFKPALIAASLDRQFAFCLPSNLFFSIRQPPRHFGANHCKSTEIHNLFTISLISFPFRAEYQPTVNQRHRRVSISSRPEIP